MRPTELYGTEEEHLSGFDTLILLVSFHNSLLVLVFSQDFLTVRKYQISPD